MITANQLPATEYNAYYAQYILSNGDIPALEALEKGREETISWITSLSQDQLALAYAKDKWTIAQVIQHIIDTERIFTYRALCIARGEQQPIPGFDQDDYAALAKANNRSVQSLIDEYDAVRKSSIALFKHLEEDALQRIGTVSGGPLSARAVPFIVTGHERHHRRIIKERYL